jgi:beta-barrel assembly-enhancing protease
MRKSFNKMMLSSIIIASVLMTSCRSLNVFPLQQDIDLGKKVSGQIEGDSKTYPILPEQGNEEAYKYLRNITKKLLTTGKVAHADEFTWQTKIVKDDKTLNAFCTPGGYIYVYTGLIKFLDSEDQLAGVMGHEMGHAALRHSTRQMTELYGLDMIASIALGSGGGALRQLTENLVGLKFSRGHEQEADDHSVMLLCATGYNAAGAAGFFRKLEAKSSGGSGTPAFLSTHPAPKNRIENMEAKAKQMGCTGKDTNTAQYNRIKQLLK